MQWNWAVGWDKIETKAVDDVESKYQIWLICQYLYIVYLNMYNWRALFYLLWCDIVGLADNLRFSCKKYLCPF